MLEHNFTLILSGDVDAALDDLYDAGCDDATFGAVDGIPYAEFDRAAATLADAVLAAVDDVQSVPGVRVCHVEPDELVTAADIARRLGRTRESVRLLIAGERGPGGFPAPASRLTERNRLWRWSDVTAWTGETPELNADVIAAVNAALELRDRSARLTDDKRRLLARLAG